ncbi:MAG: RraA family protein, partial [Oscillospiraceae bacterium]|nr:RraA family protein [Oscillospiraceae bacterium]
NVVATYPDNRELCLGLYDPWESDWYTDDSLRCMYPELGRSVGYAVTFVMGPPQKHASRVTFNDVLRAIDANPKPAIVVIKANFPDRYMGKCAVSGGNMTTAMQVAGAVGVISDGPSRDIDEIRGMGFQYLIKGVTAGHGDFVIQAVNVPVTVAGMGVAPGEVIHMDENGAVKFPREHLPGVLARVERLLEAEAVRMGRMRKAADVESLIKALSDFEEA